MIPTPIKQIAILIGLIFKALSIKESPDGSNRGYWVDWIETSTPEPRGTAWCMKAAQKIYQIVYAIFGGKCPLLNSGHCKSVWDDAKNNPRLATMPLAVILTGEHIEPGSIFIIVHHDGTGHTGIVFEHWQDDTDHRKDRIKTLEGNTGNSFDAKEYTLGELETNDFKGVIF